MKLINSDMLVVVSSLFLIHIIKLRSNTQNKNKIKLLFPYWYSVQQASGRHFGISFFTPRRWDLLARNGIHLIYFNFCFFFSLSLSLSFAKKKYLKIYTLHIRPKEMMMIWHSRNKLKEFNRTEAKKKRERNFFNQIH